MECFYLINLLGIGDVLPFSWKYSFRGLWFPLNLEDGIVFIPLNSLRGMSPSHMIGGKGGKIPQMDISYVWNMIR